MQSERKITEMSLADGRFNLCFYFDDDLKKQVDIEGFSRLILKSFLSMEKLLVSEMELPKDVILNINLNLVDEELIKKLNFDHRGKDKPTDVLSFPLQENIRQGECDIYANQMELGDLFICAEVCASQALEHKIQFLDEAIHLFVHGVLHLFGYDHEISESEDRLMRGLESLIIDEIALKG